MLLSIQLPMRPLISRWKPLSYGSRDRLKRLCNSHAWTLTKRCKDHRTATPVEREIVAWASKTKFIWSCGSAIEHATQSVHTHTHMKHILPQIMQNCNHVYMYVHTCICFGQTEPFFVMYAVIWELIGFRSIIRPFIAVQTLDLD